MKWLMPTNLKTLQSFLDFCPYNHSFIATLRYLAMFKVSLTISQDTLRLSLLKAIKLKRILVDKYFIMDCLPGSILIMVEILKVS